MIALRKTLQLYTNPIWIAIKNCIIIILQRASKGLGMTTKLVNTVDSV